MTEKRFEMIITDIDGNFYYLDKTTNEKIKSTLTLENKLNELSDENEQLKVKVDFYKYFQKDARELNKENEELKEQLSKQGTRIDFLKDENKHMRDLVNENEQLKKEVEQLKNKINTYHEGNKTLHKTLQRYKEKK